MIEEDLTIPDFLKISDEARKAAWERNPPKSASSRPLSPEQIEAARLREQHESDRKRLQRCLSKTRRANREAALDAKLEGKKAIAEGKTWDVRTARWIDPIEASLKKEEKEMVQVAEGTAPRKTKTKKKATKEEESLFGFRKDTNYDRLMIALMDKKNNFVPIKQLAEAAYDTGTDLEKHQRRVVTMARKVQEKVIVKRRLSYVIKKEKVDDALCIGIFEK